MTPTAEAKVARIDPQSLGWMLYVGGDKCGSTWIHRVASLHPQVCVPAAKDVFYFDRYYDRGLDWYWSHFDAHSRHRVACEVCHDYMYEPAAAERIAQTFPQASVFACLRNPIDRAVSAAMYWRKHGDFTGSFEALIDRVPQILERGCYAEPIRRLLDTFPRERVLVIDFRRLANDPHGVSDSIYRLAGLDPISLPEEAESPTLTASSARWPLVARAVRGAAQIVRSAGAANLVGRVKTSPLVQRLLYRELKAGERIQPQPETLSRLRDYFAADVEKLDQLLGASFRSAWLAAPAPEEQPA